MDLKIVLLLFSIVFLLLVEDTCGHPKSWLSTTTRRPRIKPKRRPKPKRSVVNLDVTYYPGLSEEYENAPKFQQLDNIKREEIEGEVEVLSSFLKKKGQKHILEDITTPRFEDRKHEITTDIRPPGGHPVYEPHLELTKPGNHNFLNTEAIKETADSWNGVAENLHRASGISAIHGIPQEVVERLLFDAPASRPGDEPKADKLSPPVNNALYHPIAQDVDASFLRRLQENRENRYQVLLNHLFQHQGRISKQNLKFLKYEKESDH